MNRRVRAPCEPGREVHERRGHEEERGAGAIVRGGVAVREGARAYGALEEQAVGQQPDEVPSPGPPPAPTPCSRHSRRRQNCHVDRQWPRHWRPLAHAS